MRKTLLLVGLLVSIIGFSQKRILSYTPSNLPVFINNTGDTFSKALLGGLNQPQFATLDINNDGKKDLIIHDRTGGIFLPFINTGNNDITTYVYSPQYVSCFPKITKGWVMFVDYDNDGKEDLWASIDFKVVLQHNITKPGDKRVKFEQTPQYLRAYRYMGYDDTSLDTSNFSSNFNNIPAIADVDGDGDMDFFSYQSGEGNLILYRNRTADAGLPLDPPYFDLADLCWGDFIDQSNAFDSIRVLPCTSKFYRKKHSGGSALLWFDNDNDGDMDLLMGNADGKNLIFLKNGKKDLNLTQDSIIGYNGHWPVASTPVQLRSFPAAFMLDADGDGVKDILVAPNQMEQTSKIEQTQQVWFYKNYGTNAFPDFKLEKKNYFTDKILDFGAYSNPVLYDIDGDGDLDLIIASNGDYAKTGNQNDRLIYFKNIGTKNKPVFKLEDEDLWKLSNDSIRYLSVSFGDISGDGKPDMVAGNYFGSLYYYKNIGSSTTWAFTTPIHNFGNVRVGERSCPQLVDLDKDGMLDLVVGSRAGNFNYYRNTGNTTNPQYTLMDDTLGNFITNELILTTVTHGSISKDTIVYNYTGNATGEIADLDGDGKYDMAFGSEEGKVRVMKFDNFNQPYYSEDTMVLFDSAYMSYKTTDYGNDTRPTAGDLDGDGIKDLIVGNDRGGITFLKGNVKILSVTDLYKRNEPMVYPNPTNGSITIFKKSNEEFVFLVYDLSGQLIQTETSAAGNNIHKMDLKTLCSGLYILQSTSSNNAQFYTRLSVLKGK